MQPNPYENVPDKELIEKYNSFTAPCEESAAIYAYLWTKHLPFIADQCRHFFSNNSYINFEDILQECAITFMDVLHSYNPARGNLITALVPHLRHTFSNYVASSNGFTQYDNLIIARIKKILRENTLSGNEDPAYLTALYNQKYNTRSILPKALKKHLEYIKMLDLVYLDQYSPELLQFTEHPVSDSVWQDIDQRTTYTIVQNYIEKAEEDSRPLLLFLFGFAPSVEIEGHLYSVNEKPHPIGPIRKAYFKLFPELIKYLYDNDCISETSLEALQDFLCWFVNLKF